MKGGYISNDSLVEITKMMNERASWWEVKGRLIHCTRKELEYFNSLDEEDLKRFGVEMPKVDLKEYFIK